MTTDVATVRRVLVVGMTGAGKTTAAQRLADRLGVPFHEMDDLAIGPGWSTPATFEQDVATVLAEPGWVIDSFGYEQVRAAMWEAADTVVWLDYRRAVILGRVLRRSLHRSFTRQPVFGGNRETWRGWLRADHPVWWAMTQLTTRRRVISELTAAAADHVVTHHFRRPAQFEVWLTSI